MSDPVAPGFVLQQRDVVLLGDLFESRIMSGAHVADIHFEGRAEAAKKRLQKLKAAGLIGERPRRAYEPAVLHLTKGGLSLLKEKGVLSLYPALSMLALEKRARVSDATIRHELDVMDVKAAFHTCMRAHDKLRVVEFGTWPRLYEFEASPGYSADIVVRPDGFIRIQEKDGAGGKLEHSFFLEVDRSTEAQSILVSRAAAYLNYYQSGGFAVRNGAPRSSYSEYPFRVLLVFKSAERRNNTAQRLVENVPPILTQAYLTTMDELISDPLGAIWIRPRDYHVAFGSKEMTLRRERFAYKRQPKRDAEAEKLVQKRRFWE
jgi:hypothetical protein